jgi:serine phosphatase RsbU (regulator of sigma subunit)
MINAITADVSAFAGRTPQQDDLTMVIIRRVTE